MLLLSKASCDPLEKLLMPAEESFLSFDAFNVCFKTRASNLTMKRLQRAKRARHDLRQDRRFVESSLEVGKGTRETTDGELPREP